MSDDYDFINTVPALSLATGGGENARSTGFPGPEYRHDGEEKKRLTQDPEVQRAIEATEEELQAFQNQKMAKTVAATAFSAALSAAVRREYLLNPTIPVQLPNYLENINTNPIQWFRLKNVGMNADFTPQQANEALEGLFSAFHLPGQKRLLFLVSGKKADASITIHIGLQTVYGISAGRDRTSSADVWNGYAKANWPGLQFEEVGDVEFGFGPESVKTSTPDKMPGVRVLTGIPSKRQEETVAATIDKLAFALKGHEWRYLVIAEPVSEAETGKVIHVCRDLAGRAESIKTFQYGENISGTGSVTTGDTTGGSTGKSRRQLSALRVAGALGAGVALAVVAPYLIPAAAAAGVAAGSTAMISFGAFSLGAGMILSGAENVSTAKNYATSVSRAISESKGISISETITNKHAEAAVKLLDANIARFELCEAVGAWEVGAYLVGENEMTAELGANVLKAILGGDNSYLEPIRISRLDQSRAQNDSCQPLIALERFENPNLKPMFDKTVVSHPFGGHFESMRTFINTRELTRLVNFPLSKVSGVNIRMVVPEMGLEKHVSESGSGIPLGVQMYRGEIMESMPFEINRDSLSKHALVAGINGSGKTTTIKKILSGLGERKKDGKKDPFPFMVIEPAKTEYVDWALENNWKIKNKYGGDLEKARSDKNWISVYMPGRNKFRGMELDEISLNPFDFIWLDKQEEPRILEHMESLTTIINAVLPMQEVLPVLMEELVYKVYSIRGINRDGKCAAWLGSREDALKDRDEGRPTFVQLNMHIDDIVDARGYDKQVSGNLKAALKTRVASFMRGWRDAIFNSEYSEPDKWVNLFEKRTVINLTSLASDDDKAFFMAVIMLALYEYRQACDEIKSDSSFKSLLVLEEAHRILSRPPAHLLGSANPQAKVSTMFSHILSELRAYGQGVLIADQVPSRLNEDAVKNTNLKIVHWLVASDDRESMAVAMNLRDEQKHIIGDLAVGEVIVREDNDKEAFHVKITQS